MFVSFLIALAVAALCASGWILSEFDLLDAHHDLDRLQHDLDVALGWHELPTVHGLHLLDRDDA